MTGPVDTECPSSVHTAPFGNWGVTSNFGGKVDGHQFDGWCHNSVVCDNSGACRTYCTSGWYQWNSCTSDPLYRAPNCSLYNTPDCRSQASVTGVNIHGTMEVDVPVGCPRDVDADGVADEGGCRDVPVYDHGPNFMSLYELDPYSPDMLVQTLYFPATPVATGCGVYGCGAFGSEWVAPSGYDPPFETPRAYAEMAMVVNGGRFVDETSACQPLAPVLWSVSAASYGVAAAPESIVASFGEGLADRSASATTNPPPLSLAGVTVEVTDQSGTAHRAGVLFVSPAQVNWVMPAAVADGQAIVSLRFGAAVRAAGQVQIASSSPALFSADSSGGGAAAALAVRVEEDGSQTIIPLFHCTDGSCSTNPVRPQGRPLYLTLFGTGIRGASRVEATAGGAPATVFYSGPQPEFAGLDQLNLQVPPGVAGVITISVMADGVASNLVEAEIR